MSDHAEPKPAQPTETTEAEEQATENKPLGLVQYPAPPGQTEYGSYKNPNR
jgi:hypothetical protein